MAKRKKRVAARKIKSKGGKTRSKALRKKATERAAPRRARKPVKKTAKKVATKARRVGAIGKKRVYEQKQILKPAAGTVETTIVDVIEEPFPGIVTVTEFEAESIVLPDSDEENEN